MTGISHTSFESLLSRARDGCIQSQGYLLESYRNYLRALARVQIHRSLKVKADASDLVQETFTRAVEQFYQFRGVTEQELLAWLRVILASRLAKFVRRHKTQRRDIDLERRLVQQLDCSSAAMDHALVQRDGTPSELVSRRELVVTVANAIEDLPEDYRIVILLRHVEGLPYAEVASAMGRSVDSVKKLWDRALAQLERSLEKSR